MYIEYCCRPLKCEAIQGRDRDRLAYATWALGMPLTALQGPALVFDAALVGSSQPAVFEVTQTAQLLRDAIGREHPRRLEDGSGDLKQLALGVAPDVERPRFLEILDHHELCKLSLVLT
mgnify:CR=1 FL=1